MAHEHFFSAWFLYGSPESEPTEERDADASDAGMEREEPQEKPRRRPARTRPERGDDRQAG